MALCLDVEEYVVTNCSILFHSSSKLIINYTINCYHFTFTNDLLRGDILPSAQLEQVLLELLTDCTSLFDLDLHMDLQPAFLHEVCQLQERNAIHLKSFRMTRSLNQTNEFEEFRSHIHRCYSLFKVTRGFVNNMFIIS